MYGQEVHEEKIQNVNAVDESGSGCSQNMHTCVLWTFIL